MKLHSEVPFHMALPLSSPEPGCQTPCSIPTPCLCFNVTLYAYTFLLNSPPTKKKSSPIEGEVQKALYVHNTNCHDVNDVPNSSTKLRALTPIIHTTNMSRPGTEERMGQHRSYSIKSQGFGDSGPDQSIDAFGDCRFGR